MCGALMTGGYGTSHTGNKYSYYICSNRKSKHTCKKRNEKQGFLDWYVVSQTVEYVLTPPRIDIVADAIIAEYENQFGIKQIRNVEARLARIDTDIKKYVESILEMPKSAHGVIRSNLERLDAMKVDLEIDLAKLRTANNIQYTRDEVKAWLSQFCVGDALDVEFRRRIIDVFVNCVYLYDDKVIIFYNIKGGKQVSYIDFLDAMDEPDADTMGESGSDMVDAVPPRELDPETLGIVRVSGIVIISGYRTLEATSISKARRCSESGVSIGFLLFLPIIDNCAASCVASCII